MRAMYSFGNWEVNARSGTQGEVGKKYRKILISAGREQEEERESQPHANAAFPPASYLIAAGHSLDLEGTDDGSRMAILR